MDKIPFDDKHDHLLCGGGQPVYLSRFGFDRHSHRHIMQVFFQVLPVNIAQVFRD